MRLLIITLLLCAAGICEAQMQRCYLIRGAAHTWMLAGQPIGIRSDVVNLNFDKDARACRFIGISNDTLLVRNIRSFRDAIITRERSDYSFRGVRDGGWEFGAELSRHKRLVTDRYQIPLASDTLYIPLAQVSRIRTYRRSVQHLSENGMEFGALFPPITAYLIYIAIYPTRAYSLKHWHLTGTDPFKRS